MGDAFPTSGHYVLSVLPTQAQGLMPTWPDDDEETGPAVPGTQPAVPVAPSTEGEPREGGMLAPMILTEEMVLKVSGWMGG